MGFVVVSSVAGGNLEVKCEEYGFSLLPALEALAPHIWQLLWRNTISQWITWVGTKGNRMEAMWMGAWGGRKAIGSNDLRGM